MCNTFTDQQLYLYNLLLYVDKVDIIEFENLKTCHKKYLFKLKIDLIKEKTNVLVKYSLIVVLAGATLARLYFPGSSSAVSSSVPSFISIPNNFVESPAIPVVRASLSRIPSTVYLPAPSSNLRGFIISKNRRGVSTQVPKRNSTGLTQIVCRQSAYESCLQYPSNLFESKLLFSSDVAPFLEIIVHCHVDNWSNQCTFVSHNVVGTRAYANSVIAVTKKALECSYPNCRIRCLSTFDHLLPAYLGRALQIRPRDRNGVDRSIGTLIHSSLNTARNALEASLITGLIEGNFYFNDDHTLLDYIDTISRLSIEYIIGRINVDPELPQGQHSDLTPYKFVEDDIVSSMSSSCNPGKLQVSEDFIFRFDLPKCDSLARAHLMVVYSTLIEDRFSLQHREIETVHSTHVLRRMISITNLRLNFIHSGIKHLNPQSINFQNYLRTQSYFDFNSLIF